MSATTKPMRCFHCLEHIIASIQQAKKHGWQVWVGGALCKRCSEQGNTAETLVHAALGVGTYLCVRCQRRVPENAPCPNCDRED